MAEKPENPEVAFWAKIVESNATRIARMLLDIGVVTLTQDYMEENGEVFFGLEIHDGRAS